MICDSPFVSTNLNYLQFVALDEFVELFVLLEALLEDLFVVLVVFVLLEVLFVVLVVFVLLLALL